MKFNNGYFGACICVLALLGCGLAGFFASVEKDTRPVTNFDYVTDVSGLFSYTDAPEYIDYNPSSNITGYGATTWLYPTSGTVIYSPSSTVNSYPYVVETGQTETLTNATITSNSSYNSDYGVWQGNSNIRFVGFGVHGRADPDNPGIGDFMLKDMKATKLSTILTSIDYSDYERIEIDVTQNDTYPVLFCHGDFSYYADYNIHLEQSGTGYYYKFTDNLDDWMPTHLKIDVASYVVEVYRGSTLLYTDVADNIGVLAWYQWRPGYPGDGGPVDKTTSVTFSGTGITPALYSYVNPKAGVKATETQSTWMNGYQNGIIDFKIIKNGDESTTPQVLYLTIPKDLSIGTTTLTFIYTSTNFQVQYRDSDNTPHNYSFGKWLGLQVRMDFINQNIIITPTNDLDMQKTIEPNDYSLVIEDTIKPAPNTAFQVTKLSAGATSLKFQVTGTKVFLNTYNTVMVNPSLKISDYFPQYTDYRVNFYSFAVVGDSITFNNQTCYVNPTDDSITVYDDGGIPHTHKLANIYLTYDDGHTYITFVNDNAKYDLGSTVNTTISFGGMWYFTTGLYKAVDGYETYWNWELDGMFHASAGECLLVFIGIIGLGIIVYSIWGRGKLGYLDWLVIVFAVFLACCLLGF